MLACRGFCQKDIVAGGQSMAPALPPDEINSVDVVLEAAQTWDNRATSSAGFPELPSSSCPLGHECFQKEDLASQRCDGKDNPVLQSACLLWAVTSPKSIYCNRFEISCPGVSMLLPLNSAQSHTVCPFPFPGWLTTRSSTMCRPWPCSAASLKPSPGCRGARTPMAPFLSVPPTWPPTADTYDRQFFPISLGYLLKISHVGDTISSPFPLNSLALLPLAPVPACQILDLAPEAGA